jgi:hypothetical protein
MRRITGEELDKLWKVGAGLQTLDYEGTTVEIRIEGDAIHYLVNGSELERYATGAYTQLLVQDFRTRVSCQWDNGFWPPE